MRPDPSVVHRRIALFALFLLTLAMFGDVLFSTTRFLSAQETDLAAQFVPWREFAVREIKAGNLPLWNPHIFGGAPYLGGFQSALLYPPNALYLLFPITIAVNLSIALHAYLTGAFMFLWARERGLTVLSSGLCGALLMFCGAWFPHIYAGHLPNLCTMAWAPLLFFSIDRMFRRPDWTAPLIGMGAVAMMIVAGHPQYVFFTAVAAAIYCGLRWIGSKEKPRTALMLAALAIGGAALAAAQLGAGMQAVSETIRSRGLSFETARMFSFPPENFLTLLAPGLFGSMKLYWGRCYLWEMAFFISATGLLLAIFGAVCAPREKRRWAGTMTLILLVLALGVHTPLFSFLFHHVPGFGSFRGYSKFTFQASLFLILLAGAGLDELLRRKRAPLPLVLSAATAGALLVAAGFWIFASGAQGGWLSRAMTWMIQTGESYLSPEAVKLDWVLAASALHGAQSLWISGGALLLAAFFLAFYGKHPGWIYGVCAVAVAELFIFAAGTRETFGAAALRQPSLEEFFAKQEGDFRTFNLQPPNYSMSIGVNEMWGYDPSVITRYAEWMAFTQEIDPDDASQYLPVKRLDRLYRMLRCRFALTVQDGQRKLFALGQPLPRAFLVDKARTMEGRDAIFQAMASEEFDPAREAILEQEPVPAPEGKEGTVGVTEFTTDSLTIEADLPKPSLLVITDLWSPGWRVRSLDGPRPYTLMPANYVLRAIPLVAGHHRFIVEYSPLAWRAGAWISLAALAGYAAAWGVLLVQRKKGVNSPA